MLGPLLFGVALAAQPDAGLIQHTGVWSAEAVTWHSTIPVGSAGSSALGVTLVLVAPLPPSAGLSAGAQGVVVGGEVVAIEVDPGVGAVVIDVVQDRDDGLFPPLIEGEAVQRITVEGADWVPDPRLGLEDRLTRTIQPGLTAKACSDGSSFGRHPICLVVDHRITEVGGLPGEVRPRAQTSIGVVLGVAALFVTTIGGLVVGNRWLERRGAAERLEAYARDEFLR